MPRGAALENPARSYSRRQPKSPIRILTAHVQQRPPFHKKHCRNPGIEPARHIKRGGHPPNPPIPVYKTPASVQPLPDEHCRVVRINLLPAAHAVDLRSSEQHSVADSAR